MELKNTLLVFAPRNAWFLANINKVIQTEIVNRSKRGARVWTGFFRVRDGQEVVHSENLYQSLPAKTIVKVLISKNIKQQLKYLKSDLEAHSLAIIAYESRSDFSEVAQTAVELRLLGISRQSYSYYLRKS